MNKLGEWIQHAFHLDSCAHLQENLFLSLCLWEWEIGKEVGRLDEMDRKCTWRHLWHYSYKFLCLITHSIAHLKQRSSVFLKLDWELSLDCTAKTKQKREMTDGCSGHCVEQKMICPLSSVCSSLSRCSPVASVARSDLSRSHRTEHPSVSTSRPASLQTVKDRVKESGGRVLSVNLESACVCLLIVTSCKCVSVSYVWASSTDLCAGYM